MEGWSFLMDIDQVNDSPLNCEDVEMGSIDNQNQNHLKIEISYDEGFQNGDLEYSDNENDNESYSIHSTNCRRVPESNELLSSSSSSSSSFNEYEHQWNGYRRDIKGHMHYELGLDIQGIDWMSLNTSRDTYRNRRIQTYKSYTNLKLQPKTAYAHEFDSLYNHNRYYNFRYMSKRSSPSIMHFQLRHLIRAVNSHRLVFMNGNIVKQWNSITQQIDTLLDLNQHPSIDASQRTQISTLFTLNNIMLVGGFRGEVIYANLDSGLVQQKCRISTAENSIVNSFATYDTTATMSRGGRLLVASNDQIVTNIDLTTFTPIKKYSFDWPINHCSARNDGALLCMVGDHRNGILLDPKSGKKTSKLQGHYDYSFASAWHPNGRIIATGNQDQTCRLWDIRHLKKSYKVIPGRMAAIRSVTFSPKGEFLVISEAADFVHVVDCASDYTQSQEITYFGETSGTDISADCNTIFIGITDNEYGGLLEFERNRRIANLL